MSGKSQHDISLEIAFDFLRLAGYTFNQAGKYAPQLIPYARMLYGLLGSVEDSVDKINNRVRIRLPKTSLGLTRQGNRTARQSWGYQGSDDQPSLTLYAPYLDLDGE